MSIDSLSKARGALQSLTESVWIFSALQAMLESGACEVLMSPVSLNTLLQATKIPEPILKQMLNLFAEAGFVITEHDSYVLASGMRELTKQIGCDKVLAQCRIASCMTNVFIKATRDKNLKAGWHFTDELLLQAQGLHSEFVVTDCLPQDQRLVDKLNQPAAELLDVGAGVGKISLRLCEDYANVNVVALEPADVPFALATKNIKASKHQQRIDLRKIILEALVDENKFDVVWFPHVFFPDAIFKTCLEKVWSALKPGGMLLTTAIAAGDVNQSLYVRHLINTLYGGFRSADEVVKGLSAVGFKEIKAFNAVAGYQTITAIK